MIESHIVVVSQVPPRHRPGTGAHVEGALAGVAGTWVAVEGADGLVDEFDMPVIGAPVDDEALELHRAFERDTLRPLCSDACEIPGFDEAVWRGHCEVLDRTAEAAAPAVDPSGLTIVVGAQLSLVPGALREHRPNARIAAVFDAPFPPIELMGRLPWRREFLEGLLAADVVAVHSERSAENLKACARRFAQAITSDWVIATPNHRVRVVVNRPAVDTGFIDELALHPDVADESAELRTSVGGPDRLLVLADNRSPHDMSCELYRAALGAFAERHPRLADRLGVILFVLDGDGSRRPVPLDDWPVPTHRIEGPMPMEERIRLLVAADALASIGVIDDLSPLPKEYVAARVGHTGALIVGDMVSAAEDLDGAMTVNPWDQRAVVEALESALTLPENLAASRMELMRSHVADHDTGAWVEQLVAALADAGGHARSSFLAAGHDIEADLRRLRHRSSSGGLTDAVGGFEHIATLLRQRSPILLLDFDGTLSPIVAHPSDAALPDRERGLVTELREFMPVAVVSGRDLDDVRDRVGIDGLWYAGSHGFDIADPAGVRPDDGPAKEFEHFVTQLDEAEEGLRRRLEGSDPGVVIERKRFTIAVHYRQAPHERLSVMSAVEEMAEKRSWLRVTGGKAVVELRPAVDWDKGAAVRWLHARLGDGDVVPIYIGDDLTDEPAFRAVREHGVGVFVGRGRHGTAARYRLDSRDQVPELLERILRTVRSAEAGRSGG
ncbi:MAG: trehalose-phosphatase [Acidimicrobiia bacterium]|nr:trehalose-phosphatase [Acidimicrobiia bacterium]